jgi:hypothetical protein
MTILLLQSIECIEKQDLTGKDDLYAVVDGTAYSLGDFDDGDTRNLDLEILLGEASVLKIYEDDPIQDDLLTSIDLTTGPFDSDRVHAVTGNGNYVFRYYVSSS